MRISERVDNAVRSMCELAAAGGGPLTADAIGKRQGVSTKYLHDILRDLKRAELLRAKRGPDGGFSLSRPADEITIADVFRAIDGPLADIHDESLRSLSYEPPADSLPIVWMAIRASLRRVLETVSLAQLVNGDLPASVAELATEYGHDTAQREST
ncbi:MAG: Rrf2 family transcriptional regulator [Ilumatobacter sp.]